MTTENAARPTDSLVRAYVDPSAISFRAKAEDASGGDTLFGHFAVYDRWTEIDSYFEGHFMERIAEGAFDRTFKERAGKIKVLFNHGRDTSVGNKPLGVPTVTESRDGGAYYEVELFDTEYVRELKPALAAGQLGASFRFGTRAFEVNETPGKSEHNPNGIPEVTRTDLDLYEFGPVTFGAYDEATAGLRSCTDDFVERMLTDPVFLARLVERAGLKNIEPLLLDARGAADAERETGEQDTSGGAADETLHASLAERRAVLARLY